MRCNLLLKWAVSTIVFVASGSGVTADSVCCQVSEDKHDCSGCNWVICACNTSGPSPSCPQISEVCNQTHSCTEWLPPLLPMLATVTHKENCKYLQACRRHFNNSLCNAANNYCEDFGIVQVVGDYDDFTQTETECPPI